MTPRLHLLAPHEREQLAAAFEAGVLGLTASVGVLRATLGGNADVGVVSQLLAELAVLGATPRIAAAWLRSLEGTAVRNAMPDLVWSGPSVEGVPSRRTRQVYDDLLGMAEHSVWVSSFAFFDGPRVFDVLARRMDAKPGLQVALLLNIQRRPHNKTSSEVLVRSFADQFWSRDWPGKTRPDVYYDPRSLDPDGPEGVLHAKTVVVDDEGVFVTSANLTGAALEQNIEVGLTIRDRSLALGITSHLRGLIERGVLVALPEA